MEIKEYVKNKTTVAGSPERWRARLHKRGMAEVYGLLPSHGLAFIVRALSEIVNAVV